MGKCIHPMLNEVLKECKDGDIYTICISGEDYVTCRVKLTPHEASVFNEVLRRASFEETYTGKFIPELNFFNNSAYERVAEKEEAIKYEKERKAAEIKHLEEVREHGAIATAFKKAGIDLFLFDGEG